jgi:hypothetical protein
MNTIITIHPKFKFLQKYIEAIPLQFDAMPQVLYKGRNVIKTDEVSNVKLVIKSYHRIYLPNRIRYSFFYPSKARRAYYYGLKLLEKGFMTPEPIAFIECFEYGLLTRSYFLSLHSDFTPISTVLTEARDFPIKDLVRFTYQLHQQGVYHMDYSVGNILFKKHQDKFHFALVDNNRMKFGKFRYSDRLKNFRRLGLSNEQLMNVAEEYSSLERSNDIETIEKLFHYVRKHRERNVLMTRVKKFALNVGNRLVTNIMGCLPSGMGMILDVDFVALGI